jgi:hypothetical protein
LDGHEVCPPEYFVFCSLKLSVIQALVCKARNSRASFPQKFSSVTLLLAQLEVFARAMLLFCGSLRHPSRFSLGLSITKVRAIGGFMKNRMAVAFAFAVFFSACGENKHSETLSNPGADVGLLASSVSADALAMEEKACGPADFTGAATSEKMRFVANVSASCRSRNAVLLAKYPSTVFPSVSGVNCVLLRSQEELAKYGDFSFRCTGRSVAFPALGGEFVFELPAVKGLNVSAVKLRVIPE